ncbi:MAG: hypothetical protein H0U45_13760 [Tatlockia sp.]|jgi:IS1 family transposase|nr:hypothetical protein [Tatlockia sp.]
MKARRGAWNGILMVGTAVKRILPDEVDHEVSKSLRQRLERTNGIVRQQTGRWHRRQNKVTKIWEQTLVTLRLIVNSFNWI